MSTSRDELFRNVEAFKRLDLASKAENIGKFAVLYDGELQGIYPDKETARIEAARKHPEGGTAISPAIGNPPAQLGAIGLLLA